MGRRESTNLSCAIAGGMEGRTRKKNKSASLYIRSSPSGLPPKLEVPGPLACHSCPLMSLAQIGPPFLMSQLIRPGDYLGIATVGAEGAQSLTHPRERKREREGGRGDRPDTCGRQDSTRQGAWTMERKSATAKASRLVAQVGGWGEQRRRDEKRRALPRFYGKPFSSRPETEV